MITVIKFAASWCGPCKALAPTWEAVKSEYKSATFKEVDIDDNPSERMDHEVQAVPTMIIMSNGKEVARKTGNVTKRELTEWLEQFDEFRSVQPDLFSEPS